MRDCLLVIDLFSEFDFEGGERVLGSLRSRARAIRDALDGARERSLPIVYANDTRGVWNGNASELVERALAGPGGDVLKPLAPRRDDAFVVKPRYSAFDLTPLELVLSQLGTERIVLCGTTTEMCVAQTAIDARERELKVTVLTGACATKDESNEAVALAYLESVTGTWLVPGFADL